MTIPVSNIIYHFAKPNNLKSLTKQTLPKFPSEFADSSENHVMNAFAEIVERDSNIKKIALPQAYHNLDLEDDESSVGTSKRQRT